MHSVALVNYLNTLGQAVENLEPMPHVSTASRAE
jgi:hypothetical protein